MTVHSEHPFATPPEDRRVVRRFRGRLPQPVTVWTSVRRGRPVGLTVSSVMVADGEPGHVAGLIDPDSDLMEGIESSGRCCVSVLAWRHRGLADAMAGVAPAPGGPFAADRWTDTAWGPALSDAVAWCGVEVTEQERVLGWSRLVTGRIDHVVLADPAETLSLFRGRYARGH